MIRSNYHTHTIFCDGKDTPAQLACTAEALGFVCLGFSGHAPSRSESYAMSPEQMACYSREIEQLKQQYAGRLEILHGVELDLFSDVNGRDFDYCIASVHAVEKDGTYLLIDESVEIEAANLSHYGNDFAAYAADYYEAVIASVEKHQPDIIGHLDLLTKFCERTARELSPAYWDIAEHTVRKLAAYDIPFEINTGAVARGYRTTFYPMERLLRCIRACGGTVIFSSDCHDRRYLNYGFEEAARLAADCGFDSYAVLTAAGRKYLPL